MATGDIHKFGTVYLDDEAIEFPTKPWHSTYEGIEGNLYDATSSTSKINRLSIKDTKDIHSEKYKIQWVEINDGDEKILICNRNLVCDNERSPSYLFDSKQSASKVNIDGRNFKIFALSSGKYSDKGEETEDEWGRYILNYGNFPKLPVPTEDDLKSYNYKVERFKSAHNKFWNWAFCASIASDYHNRDNTAEICTCGKECAQYKYYIEEGKTSSSVGWRPALLVVNDSITFSPKMTNLGALKEPRSIICTVQSTASSPFEINVKIDDIEFENLNGQYYIPYSIDLNKCWNELAVGTHTITITATDELEKSVKTYSFEKLTETPMILSPLNGERRESDFYVEFKIGALKEEHTQSIQVNIADDAAMVINTHSFDEIEKFVENEWIQADRILTNKDIESKFRAHITGVTQEKYLQIVATDLDAPTGFGAPSNKYGSTIVNVKHGTVIEVMTHPSETQNRAQEILVLLDSTIDSEATQEIWVCNNANDTLPTWELYIKTNESHVFKNTSKAAEKWAVAVKVKITANNSVKEIALRAIGMGVV